MSLLTAKTYLTKLIFLLCLFTTDQLLAQTIKGKVLDAANGEPLVGASVSVDGAGLKELVKLDGTFLFKNVKPGNYSIKVDFVGYTMQQDYTVRTAVGQVQQVTIVMQEGSMHLANVTVTAGNSRDNDKSVRRLERIAEPVMNTLSSKVIQLLPGITVANALQRVSG